MEEQGDECWFVVRSDGRWNLAPVPEAEPTQVTVDALARRMSSGVGKIPPSFSAPTGPAARTLGPDDRIAPVWMLVGLVAEGALLIADPAGAPVRLDPIDVHLLDALDREQSVSELGASEIELELADRCRRAGRLVSAGAATLVAVGERTFVDIAEADSSEPSRSRIVRLLGRWVSRSGLHE